MELFSSQFLTGVFDHLVIHWGICLILLYTDVYLLVSDRWSEYKKQEKKIPDSTLNILGRVLFNQFFVTIPMIWITANFFPYEEGSIFFIDNIRKICTAFLILEFLFFYSHQLFHTKYLYQKIHKIHHRWTAPICLSATYAHPVEHLLSNVLPVILSGKLAGLNFTMARLWHIFTLSNTLIVAHGGYAYGGNMHDLHHEKFNCNYGAIGLLDYLHGTYE